MINKTCLAIIMLLVVNLGFAPSVFAFNNPDEEAGFTEKVKAGISKIGVGTRSKIKVKLKDGTKLKGYVSEITEDGFSVTNTKTKKITTVLYSESRQIRGNNLSSQVIIGIAVVAAIIISVIVIGVSAK